MGDLLALIDAERPDLVCAYRNLHSSGWRWPYTLGDHVVVLTPELDRTLAALEAAGLELRRIRDTTSRK